MHRVILGLPGEMDGDHRNGDGLDNRRSNLRPATAMQNSQNQGVRKTNKAGLKGVSWWGPLGKWKAGIQANGTPVHLGYFETPEAAARAYDAAARLYHGEFAKTNFSQEPDAHS